jgi:subtilisin family serine protease
MKNRIAIVLFLIAAICVGSASAQNQVIARDPKGLQDLQNICSGLVGGLLGGLHLCTVTEAVGDPQGQVYVVAPGQIGNVYALLRFLLRALLPNGGDAELDRVLRVTSGTAWTAPPSLYDTTPSSYYGTTVWHGYITQPAVGIIKLRKAQSSYHVSGSGVVAVIDTGVDPTHPVLRRVLLAGYDFTRNQRGGSELTDLSQPGDIDNNANPYQVNQSTMAVVNGGGVATLSEPQYQAFGHGTMVSGIVHLVAPTARILPLKAFRANGTGNLSDVLRAVYYAMRNNATVLNMSFDVTTYSLELDKATKYAAQCGSVSVASVGNDGKAVMVYPAGLSSVMGIASTANNDTISTFSNYGQPPVWVGAPGEGIVTIYPYGTYAAGWGTSFSAPFVSGTAALLRSISTNLNQSTAAQALAHAQYINSELGYGRIDVYQAAAAWCQASHCEP